MRSLYEEGKRNKTGRPSKKESLGPRNQTYEKPHNTNEEIGEAIGVSLYKMVSPNFPPISIFS